MDDEGHPKQFAGQAPDIYPSQRFPSIPSTGKACSLADERRGAITMAKLPGVVADEINELFACRLTEWASGRWPDAAFGGLENALINLCQSPIERILLVNLLFAEWAWCDWRGVDVHDYTMPGDMRPSTVTLAPQYPCGKYNIDIAVLIKWRGDETLCIAVECDGHDFHEKTAAQAAHDKRRDRELQKAGYFVFRFTGSEIVRDSKRVAREIAKFADNWIWKASGWVKRSAGTEVAQS